MGLGKQQRAADTVTGALAISGSQTGEWEVSVQIHTGTHEWEVSLEAHKHTYTHHSLYMYIHMHIHIYMGGLGGRDREDREGGSDSTG